MLRVALTGGIATGKSYVLERLREHGVPTLDADELAHGVTAAGTEATSAIAARFGADVLDASGAVDRRKLGPLVFGDPAARHDLEAIVHPAVYRAIHGALRGLERLGSPIAVADVPLLFETGRAADFDAVVVTACSDAEQLDRLKARGLNEIEAKQRLDAQMPTADKASRADFVVHTGGSFEDTDVQVRDLVQSLTKRALFKSSKMRTR
jgi:dephospho-CoA kinase